MKPTPEELEILNNDHFLLVKNQVSEKVISYLAAIERSLHAHIQQVDPGVFPEGAFLKSGKIAKGEQYKGLPYFILDYPRLFTQKQVFAFRVMLWWGNHFSCTLHLQGPPHLQQPQTLIKKLMEHPELYFCVNTQPWDYHYEHTNYRQVKNLNQDNMRDQIERHGFIKISKYLPVTSWDNFQTFTLQCFDDFLRLIAP
ncbi:hypothetical protein [Marinoscillum furvescens]|uniref:Uncharacterized protein n=1 Tax=Marinoscillum furvescens DSM 4134 TaxID=1122208 RepID=A0A3D9LJY5_MARFU|nr:hypothetical protein [Marinoscillum furvescens]REE05562.1 hypothetical protein C7460_10178 [Marinoscillum furvescens DSM 4134]